MDRELALRLLPTGLHGGEVIIVDKGYVSHRVAATISRGTIELVVEPYAGGTAESSPTSPANQAAEFVI